MLFCLLVLLVIESQTSYLFNRGFSEHSWPDMVENIGNYIRSLNWKYRKSLKDKNVSFLHAYARFIDNHTLAVSLTLLYIWIPPISIEIYYPNYIIRLAHKRDITRRPHSLSPMTRIQWIEYGLNKYGTVLFP